LPIGSAKPMNHSEIDEVTERTPSIAGIVGNAAEQLANVSPEDS
jgi:hypothetical protein